MSDEQDELDTIEAMKYLPQETSINAAMKRAKKKKTPVRLDRFKAPPIERFKKILRRAGVDERFVAEKIVEMFNAEKITISRAGEVKATPDNAIRMKAIELFLSYYVPRNADGKGNNHVHFHGDKKIDELFDKARRD